MRLKFLYFITIFLVLGCDLDSNNNSQNIVVSECDCNALILDQSYNRFYLKEKKKPFTGVCKSYYPNGNIKMERHYVEGKYHGDVIDYYNNGQIKSISQYKNHFINGFVKTYNKKGELISHIEYKQSTQIKVVESHPELLN